MINMDDGAIGKESKSVIHFSADSLWNFHSFREDYAKLNFLNIELSQISIRQFFLQ